MALRPMLATAATELPTGPGWSYEVKWDGYRALAVKDEVGTRLISRNDKDLTADYPEIVAALRSLPSKAFVLDGEIVALDDKGHPSFQALQHRRTQAHAVAYYAFDVLSVGGESVRSSPLDARRTRLKTLVKGSPILLSEPLPGSPKDIETQIRRMGLEGVVAKRRDSPYLPGERSHAWVKVKFSPQQEFVVGGYKPSDANFESILVGYFDHGKLHFAGKVRAGLTPHVKAEIFREIFDRQVRKCPFVNLPNSKGSSHWGEGITEEDMTKLRWVKPQLVVQVSFVEWTADGLLRHSAFVGLRRDKNPRDVVREQGHGT
jgi:bifunctional non-homologous end joining protein LigD